MSAERKDSCLIRAKLLLTKFKHQEPELLMRNTLIRNKISSEGKNDDKRQYGRSNGHVHKAFGSGATGKMSSLILRGFEAFKRERKRRKFVDLPARPCVI